jgi:hypothetical protein
MMKNANIPEDVKCKCGKDIPYPIMDKADRKLSDVLKSKGWINVPIKEVEDGQQGHCVVCNMDKPNCKTFDCTHIYCIDCITR